LTAYENRHVFSEDLWKKFGKIKVIALG